jgi:predicted aspartyl protease|tara:strand:+ start:701 stop:871 length:171 start_codon:yes stop_codon:yes gene_type:complete
METNQIMSAIFLIAVLALVLPGFLSSNNKIKQFMKNLSIWSIIVLVIIVIIYLIKK